MLYISGWGKSFGDEFSASARGDKIPPSSQLEFGTGIKVAAAVAHNSQISAKFFAIVYRKFHASVEKDYFYYCVCSKLKEISIIIVLQ